VDIYQKKPLTKGCSLKTTITSQVTNDKLVHSLKDKALVANKKYKKLLAENRSLAREVRSMKSVGEVSTFSIRPSSVKSEAVPVIVASDWHYEELVLRSSVSGLNEFNLDIAHKRSVEFFQNALVLINIFKRDVKINTIVLALIGDFISGSIHEELAESNQLAPIEALMAVQERLASGIQFLLDNSNLKLVIPCHTGNHGRTTAKQRHATDKGNSFEYYMYHQLANHFRKTKRVKFLVADGYHSYVDIHGYVVRFHHGHMLKFNGGVGGLTIPANKAIAQWNRGRRADLDIFG
jgi:hypothetical protein